MRDPLGGRDPGDLPRLVSVAVPVPGLDLLTYRLPADFEMPRAGVRVLVPLATRVVTGCVIESGRAAVDGESSAQGATRELREIIDVLDDRPFLPREIVELALWMGDYYAAAPGEAIATAMPPAAWVESEREVRLTEAGRSRFDAGETSGLRGAILSALASGKPSSVKQLAGRLAGRQGASAGAVRRAAGPGGLPAALGSLARLGWVDLARPLKGRAVAFKTVRVAALTPQGHERADELPGLGSRQREALQILSGAPNGLPLPVLAARGIAANAIERLAAKGLVAVRRCRVERDPFERSFDRLEGGAPQAASVEGRIELELTAAQAGALDRLAQLAGARSFRVALLHGVTGSGKTEIYLRLAQSVRQSGRAVLMLVPEIALTPAVVAACRRAFRDRVAIQHSGLSSGERHDQWHRIRDGDVDVVVGTRSAVFAPLHSLGLIVVDEEHDSSYKQDDSPRYNGRDVAVMRGKRADALVVLGSATPSLETYQNAMAGRYEHIALERRVLDRPLAAVRLVDMREEYAAGGPDVILSRVLAEGIAARLQRREQVLILLNRRGYAMVVFCRQCGATVECPNCSVSLTVHRGIRRARCHYCNYSIPVPAQCLLCAGPYLEQLGFGTERVEAVVGEAFPQARVARLDRDTVRRQGALDGLLARFGRREIDVLIGTQMVAKGHDFPGVTLVGVVSADVGLGLADFRAAERTFQLLTQVAGRAGRGERTGEAVIQTLYPDHYSIRYACRQDYVGFFEEEMKYRRAMRYPPLVNLVNVVVRARTAGAAMADASEIARRLRSVRDFRVLGPAPAPLVKLKGEHRAQLFLKGTRRATMRDALQTALAGDPDLRRRVLIDVDPLAVL